MHHSSGHTALACGGGDTVAGGNGTDVISDDSAEIDETFELFVGWLDQG